MKAINLKTEYLNNPLGIDIQHPRLFWNCENGVKQKAFQIKAFTNGNLLWDSTKVISSSMHFDFPLSLSSRTHVDWKVKIWDENDIEGDYSDLASFEMGLLDKDDFVGKWITGNYKPNKKKSYPVDYFKKEFTISSFTKARAYITACGLYEAMINDKRIGDFILAPGSTDYRKRIQYQTYDVTELLQKGNNTITLQLADGFYRGSNGAKGRRNTYGKETKFFFQLEVFDESDNKTTIISDDSWNWSNDGPILFADLKDGEIIDANKIPSYSNHAKVVDFTADLKASNNVFVKEHEHFKPIRIIKTKKGKTVLEFPQNISGYLSFKFKANKGDKIHITLGEMLDSDGEFTLKNVQCTYKKKKSPLQEFDYICKDGINEYTPKFFYGGFKYALIEIDIPFDKDDFTAIALYSDFEETSSFKCSNELINKFYANTLWSLKSNSTDIPSDCPTRERMGWTGDSQIFFNTASYLTDYASFSRKHIADIFDRQWKSGRLPQIAPFANEDWFMWTMNGSVGWACAGVYIPLYFYKKYGDERILEKYYDQILKYADFMIKRAGKWGGPYAKRIKLSKKNRKYFVNCGQSYGEWAEPNDVCAFHWYDFASPHPEESTAYTYFTLKRVLEITKILNKPQDERLNKIKEYSEGAKKAYQELVERKDFTLDTDRQAKLVRPLYMDLLDDKQTKYAKERLIKALDNYGWRLGTGFLSTPMILDVLTDIDIKYAYRLLENEEMPGWLFMPKNGATTIWESWEGNSTPSKGIASLNHYSKGAVVEWLINTMCGINIVGENKFLISPKVGGKETFANCEYRSIYGKVACGWRKENENIVYKIAIPENTSAKVILNGEERELQSGNYEFTIKNQE